jgi:hypothetical protein
MRKQIEAGKGALIDNGLCAVMTAKNHASNRSRVAFY